MKDKNCSTALLVSSTKTKMMKNNTLILLGVLVAVCCVAAGLLGGFEKVDVDRDDVVRAGNEAARGLSKKLAGKFHHRLQQIKKAEAQVVAGTNYKMTVIVGMTTCEKNQSFDEIQNCDFQDGISTYKKCIVMVYRDLNDKHTLVSSGCVLAGKNEI